VIFLDILALAALAALLLSAGALARMAVMIHLEAAGMRRWVERLFDAGVKIATILKPGPPLADITGINSPCGAVGDVHESYSHHLHRWLGLRNRLQHHRATPTADDQPGEHPARVAIPAGS